MRAIVRLLGSLKLAVGLLIVLSFALGVGTIIDSTKGTEAARAVYYAPWFYLLEAIFGLNVLFALIDRWPRNRQRIPTE